LESDEVIEKETQEISPAIESNDEQLLLRSMGFDPVPIDQLVLHTGFSPEAISSMLLMLELNNKVSSNGGGTYTRLK